MALEGIWDLFFGFSSVRIFICRSSFGSFRSFRFSIRSGFRRSFGFRRLDKDTMGNG